MIKQTINVDGMHCQMCSASIDKALNALPGVRAKADHSLGRVELELEDAAVLEQVKAAVEDLGFDVV